MKLFRLIALFSISLAAHAAPSIPSTYEIEVIVFENRLSNLEAGELWRPAQEAPAAAREEPVNVGEKNPVGSALSAARQSLERSGSHRVLAHQRWQQGADAKSASKPVRIGGGAGGLDGALRLYSSRVLIVELNLALKDAPAGTLTAGIPQTGPVVYQLNESRRVKISETHYFDHPKLGALVRISPVKAPAAGASRQP